MKSCLDNLKYSGQVSVHVADDGSPQAHRDNLVKIAGGYKRVIGVSSSNSEGRGYGASYNLASQTTHIHASYVLPLEDDWQLQHKLDLDEYVQAMESRSEIGCIRLGYLGYTQQLCGHLIETGYRHYLMFDPDSSERHVCAGHPRLESVGWQKRVGLWPEGVDPGTTEFTWCGYEAARNGVVWPMNAPANGWFGHIGAVQAREDQR